MDVSRAPDMSQIRPSSGSFVSPRLPQPSAGPAYSPLVTADSVKMLVGTGTRKHLQCGK